MIFPKASDGWAVHKLFPFLTSQNWKCWHISGPVGSFLTKDKVRHGLLAVIVSILILEMQLDLPLASELSLTFTWKAEDVDGKFKPGYSNASSGESWNICPSRANPHPPIGWALSCHFQKSFLPTRIWTVSKGIVNKHMHPCFTKENQGSGRRNN